MSGATSIGDICGIQWFAARDIDVWLAEELRLNAGFARWFLDKIGGDSDITVPAYRVRISVCQGRETDVEALFHASADSTLAVLVEDKIKADFQSNQMEDYIKRGELGVKEGRWDRFAVVVFAPGYRTPFMNLPANVITLKFEEASEAMRLQDPNDSRLLYRAAFLKRAAQPTILVAENENQFVIQWWVAVNELVRSKFGDFFRPQTPRKTTYVNPRCADQPSYLRLDLKGDQGLAALAFINFPESRLRELLSSISTPDDMHVLRKKNWKDPVIQISNLQKYEVGDDLESVQDKISAAYEAAYRLLNFWRENRSRFDDAASTLATAAV